MIRLIINRFEDVTSTNVFKTKVEATADTSGLKKAKKDIVDVKNDLQSLNDVSININTSSISNSIKQLENLKKVLANLHKKKSVNLTDTIGKLNESGTMNVLPENVKKTLTQLEGIQSANADKDTYMTTKKSLTSLINELKKLEPSTEEAKKAVDDLTKSVNDLGKSEEDNGKKTKTLGEKVKDLIKDFKNMPNLIDTVSKSFKAFDYTKLVNFWRTIRRVTSGLVSTVANAADYEESLNLYRMALQGYADEATRWSDTITEKLKLDPSDVMKYTGAFYNLTKGMKVASDDAFLMSKNLTQLTYDMSSYLNISVEAAQAKIQSAMAGQSRAVATAGVATQAASLQELAYSMNIKKKVANMTQAEKTYLRYIQLMRSTTQMQGDLGRTMITPANAIRTLKNQINLLSRAIGQVLTPIIMEVIPYIMALTNVLKKAATALANFFGYKISDVNWESALTFDSVEEGVNNLNNLSGAAKKASDSVNESLAPFDELNNVISESKTAGSGGGYGDVIDSSIWKDALPTYDMLKDYTDEFVKKAESLEGTVENILGMLATFFAGKVIGDSIIWVSDLVKSFKDLNTLTHGWYGRLTLAAIAIAGIAGTKISIDNLIENAKEGDPNAELDWRGSDQSWLEDLADPGPWTTILAGAAAGAGAGGLIGSFVPVVGTAIGASIGAITGSFAAMLVAIGEGDKEIQKQQNRWAFGYVEIEKKLRSVGAANEEVAIGLEKTWQSVETQLKPIDNAERLYNQLQKVVDENGKVVKGHEAEADAIVKGLNEALGTNIKIRDGQIEGYKKVQTEISKLIEKKKAQIKIEAMEEAYKQGLIDEQKALKALNDAEKTRTKALQGVRDAENLSAEAQREASKKYQEACNEYDQAKTHYKETISSKITWERAYGEFLQGHYDEVNNIFDNSAQHQYDAALQGLIDSTNLIKGPIGEEQIAAWKAMGEESKDEVNKALCEISDPDTRAAIIAALGLLKAPVAVIAGETGELYASDAVYSIQDYMSDPNHSITPKLVLPPSTPAELQKPINDYFKSHNVDFTVNANTTPKEILDQFLKYFKKNPLQLAMDITSGKLSNILGLLRITKAYANGGFPTSGDLFFANENGVPEYITSVGNKSAVINQGQMIATLSNAIVAGFQQFGGNQPNNVVVYVGDKKLYEGQGEYQNRQNDRYGTTVVKI